MVELGFSNNDLDEKFHNMIELAMEEPCIQKMIDNRGTPSLKLAFQFYILWTCSHADEMVQRKVLDDNEWAGWLQWMRNCFRKASIKETWKQVEQDRCQSCFSELHKHYGWSKTSSLIKNNNKIRPALKYMRFPFKMAFNKFQNCLMVCPYRCIMVEFFKFFRSEAMLLLSHGGNLWKQQDFISCADICL